MKIILLGNAGAGKTMMARRLIGDRARATLSLDEIAWDADVTRKSLSESKKLLDDFICANQEWIIEGCYSDLVEHALPHCEELRFLNPGVATCIKHCTARPWEPEKFDSPDLQEKMLSNLLDWVQEYEMREDEYGLKRHGALFDGFKGDEREYSSVEQYVEQYDDG